MNDPPLPHGPQVDELKNDDPLKKWQLPMLVNNGHPLTFYIYKLKIKF